MRGSADCINAVTALRSTSISRKDENYAHGRRKIAWCCAGRKKQTPIKRSLLILSTPTGSSGRGAGSDPNNTKNNLAAINGGPRSEPKRKKNTNEQREHQHQQQDTIVSGNNSNNNNNNDGNKFSTTVNETSIKRINNIDNIPAVSV